MSARDDLERVGAEALRWTRAGMDAGSRVPGLYDTAGEDYLVLARAVLDALLASRDADGNRMVILASELEQVGWVDPRDSHDLEPLERSDDGSLAAYASVLYENGGKLTHELWHPVFVFRPPSGEVTE